MATLFLSPFATQKKLSIIKRYVNRKLFEIGQWTYLLKDGDGFLACWTQNSSAVRMPVITRSLYSYKHNHQVYSLTQTISMDNCVTYQLGAWEIWDRSCLSPFSSKGHGQIFAYWVQISIVENPSFRICMSYNTWRSPLFSESIRFFSSSSLLTFFLNFGNSCRRSSLTSSRDFSWWFKPEKENNIEKSTLLGRLQIWPTSVCQGVSLCSIKYFTNKKKTSFTIIASLRLFVFVSVHSDKMHSRVKWS